MNPIKQIRNDILRHKIEPVRSELMRKNIHNTLRHYRKKKGMTMDEVACNSGIGKTTMHDLEHGHYWPSLEKARCIEKVLGVSIDTLWPIDLKIESLAKRV